MSSNIQTFTELTAQWVIPAMNEHNLSLLDYQNISVSMYQ